MCNQETKKDNGYTKSITRRLYLNKKYITCVFTRVNRSKIQTVRR